MRRWPLGLLICACVLAWSLPALAGAVLQVENLPLVKGQPALVRVCGSGLQEPLSVVFRGASTPLAKGVDGCWHGILAVDLATPPGKRVIRVHGRQGQVAAARVKVLAGDYGTRRITVDSKFLELTPSQLARYKKEVALIKKVYQSDSRTDNWREAFALPLDSKVVSAFGRRSFVNGRERSPHGGVDLRGATGTPIHAPAAGRVALVMDTFFGGGTLLVDHGRGLITIYMHLSETLVKEGDEVAAGDLIARVGATGRVTGPHLHYGVCWHGAKLDPMTFTEMSRALAARLGD